MANITDFSNPKISDALLGEIAEAFAVQAGILLGGETEGYRKYDSVRCREYGVLGSNRLPSGKVAIFTSMNSTGTVCVEIRWKNAVLDGTNLKMYSITGYDTVTKKAVWSETPQLSY